MRKTRAALLCATACGCAMAATGARAADLAIPSGYEVPGAPLPTFLWTGAYAGVDGGYAFDEDAKFRTHVDVLADKDYPREVPGASPRVDSGGATVGGHVGYNFQFGRFVVGVETDASYVDGSKSVVGSIGDQAVTSRQSLDFLGTFRARAGYAVGSALFYGTGGLAYGSTSARLTAASFDGMGRDDVRVGYAAGGGVEFALGTSSFLNFLNARGVTARVEYLHYGLGTSNLGTTYFMDRTGTTLAVHDKARFEGDLARAGLSYQF